MSQSFHLFQLQKIDTQYDKIVRRLEEIERAIARDPALISAAQALQESTAAELKAQHRLREVEENVRAKRIKMEQSEGSLYGGKIRVPKELQDLQTEISSLKKQISLLEDQQLDAMVALESAQQTLSLAKDKHAQAQALTTAQNASLSGERSELIRSRERLDLERNAVTAQIASINLEHYQALRRQKHGVAVTGVDSNSCAVCGGSMTMAEWQAARSPTTIAHCPTCGRILYAG